jgi:hypothetical protein
MSTAPVVLQPAAETAEEQPSSEHFERPNLFGRVRWWFEETPMSLVTAVALALVTIGFLFLLTVRSLRADPRSVLTVALQAVQAENLASIEPQQPSGTMEIEQLSAGEKVERQDERIELPELPTTQSQIKPEELLGNQADSDKTLKETDAALREAGELLRRMLQANQSRGQGDGAGTGKGKGELNPDSTPGRQARWIITYPTLPQGEYERMLDSFRIELAYLDVDRKTMRYLGTLSGAGKKYNGDVQNEERMFWYWMGQNRLRELDDSILRRHGLDPTSEVVHLYAKDLEKKLAEMERAYLFKQFKTSNVELVAQTNFKILPGGASGWHIEVTSIVPK